MGAGPSIPQKAPFITQAGSTYSDVKLNLKAQHINESDQDLEELNQILQTRNWSRLERKGAERLIQTLVEACIGIAKHWLKQQSKVLPGDAYSVFETLPNCN